MMKKRGFLVVLTALVLFVGFLSGCDNRSQLEKDADAAAKKAQSALR